MKESRLFFILYHLVANRTVTAGQLADKLDVSVRTIYRDVERLCEAGIPVYTTSGRQGGLALVEGYTLDSVLFSSEEKRTILASLQSLDATQEPGHEVVVEKLSALFGDQEDSWLEVDFSGWGSRELDNRKFNMVRDAVINHRVLEIEYCNSKGEQDIRILEPLQMLYKARAWYLKAYCRTNGGFRLFKLSRILSAKAVGRQVEKKCYPAPSPTEHEAPYTTFILRFSAVMAYRVYDEFDATSVQKEKDGTLLVTTCWPYDSWVAGYVLSFGPSVTVVEPQCLRDEIHEMAKKLCELYKT